MITKEFGLRIPYAASLSMTRYLFWRYLGVRGRLDIGRKFSGNVLDIPDCRR